MNINEGTLTYLPNGNGPFTVLATFDYLGSERAAVFWLDKEDKPHREIFPINILSTDLPKLLEA